MRWSLNEARVICQRAAVGAGVPYGLAEDAAAAAAWLAAGGLPGMAVFRRCLDRFQSGQAAAV
ncbi:MAG TPA: DUF3726 domain-containing protein, partial [Arenicellales bacterium]|nr:DUF3726 domain-containing protein [Arenicellales bacterium]